MKHEINKFADMLRAHQVSVTEPRIEIFKTLLDAKKPLKNGEVARRTPTIDRTSVYRNLKLFAQVGVTHTTIQGWTPLTELAEPFKAHHHHMTCEKCGGVTEIEDSILEKVLQTIVSKHNFTLHQHVVELSGVCKTCSLKAKLPTL